MSLLSNIALGIGINIASNRLKSITDYFNLYHCSSLVKNEINQAFDDALNSWSKSDVATRTQMHLKNLVNDHYSSLFMDNSPDEIPKEFSEFLGLFEYAISKRKSAYRYLSSQKQDSFFREIIKNQASLFDNASQLKDAADKNLEEVRRFRDEANQKLDLITSNLDVKEANSNSTISFDKFNIQLPRETFTSSSTQPNVYIQRRVLKSIPKNTPIVEPQQEEQSSYIDEELLKTDHDLIILEGEPGQGKSIELNHITHKIWSDPNNDIIPFYRNLRNFTTQDKIETFLSEDLMKDFINVVYVLDGIDEIKDPSDFISKLNNHKASRRNRTSRFLLSCRSNILKRLIREIEGAETYKLIDLNEGESIELFERLTNIQLLETQRIELIQTQFIGDPFRIKLLADYYTQHGIIENDEFRLWSHYISSSLQIDEEQKFSKRELFAPQVLEDAKKSALIHELMNQYLMERTDLFKILEYSKDRLEQFERCSLINREMIGNNFFFNHRKIQECLTAMFLSHLSIESISIICKVSSTDAIKPQL